MQPSSTLKIPNLQNIAIDVENGAIAILKLNRPTALNALNPSILTDLNNGLQWAEAESAIRVIILTGEGRNFTAGLDLLDKDVKAADSTVSDKFVDALSAVQESLINTNKVLITAVKGPSPGWGTSSLALSDLVYSTPDAYFFTPFVKWGLCAEASASQALARIMGRQKASSLILAGARFSARDLEAAGLITQILDRDGFMDSVLLVAKSILESPAEALTTNKKLMMIGTRELLLETNRREMIEFRRLARSKECRDAVATFGRRQDEKNKKKKKQGVSNKL